MKGKRLVLVVLAVVVVIGFLWFHSGKAPEAVQVPEAQADEYNLVFLPVVGNNYDPSVPTPTPVPSVGCGEEIVSPSLPTSFYAPEQMGEIWAEVYGPDEHSDSFWIQIGEGEPFPYHIPDTGRWQEVKLLDLPVSGKVSIWVREEGSQMRRLWVLCPDLFCDGQPIEIEWGDVVYLGNTLTDPAYLQIHLTPDGGNDSGWVEMDDGEPQWIRVREGKAGWLPTGEYAEDPVITISPGFHKAYVYEREGGILGGIRCTTDVFAP